MSQLPDIKKRKDMHSTLKGKDKKRKGHAQRLKGKDIHSALIVNRRAERFDFKRRRKTRPMAGYAQSLGQVPLTTTSFPSLSNTVTLVPGWGGSTYGVYRRHRARPSVPRAANPR